MRLPLLLVAFKEQHVIIFVDDRKNNEQILGKTNDCSERSQKSQSREEEECHHPILSSARKSQRKCQSVKD